MSEKQLGDNDRWEWRSDTNDSWHEFGGAEIDRVPPVVVDGDAAYCNDPAWVEVSTANGTLRRRPPEIDEWEVIWPSCSWWRPPELPHRIEVVADGYRYRSAGSSDPGFYVSTYSDPPTLRRKQKAIAKAIDFTVDPHAYTIWSTKPGHYDVIAPLCEPLGKLIGGEPITTGEPEPTLTGPELGSLLWSKHEHKVAPDEPSIVLTEPYLKDGVWMIDLHHPESGRGPYYYHVRTDTPPVAPVGKTWSAVHVTGLALVMCSMIAAAWFKVGHMFGAGILPLTDSEFVFEDPDHVTFDLAEAVRWCFRHNVSAIFTWDEDTAASILELRMPISKDREYFYSSPVVNMIEAPWVFREMCEKVREKYQSYE